MFGLQKWPCRWVILILETRQLKIHLNSLAPRCLPIPVPPPTLGWEKHGRFFLSLKQHCRILIFSEICLGVNETSSPIWIFCQEKEGENYRMPFRRPKLSSHRLNVYTFSSKSPNSPWYMSWTLAVENQWEKVHVKNSSMILHMISEVTKIELSLKLTTVRLWKFANSKIEPRYLFVFYS